MGDAQAEADATADAQVSETGALSAETTAQTGASVNLQ
jgi:hypothetical protein